MRGTTRDRCAASLAAIADQLTGLFLTMVGKRFVFRFGATRSGIKRGEAVRGGLQEHRLILTTVRFFSSPFHPSHAFRSLSSPLLLAPHRAVGEAELVVPDVVANEKALIRLAQQLKLLLQRGLHGILAA